MKFVVVDDSKITEHLITDRFFIRWIGRLERSEGPHHRKVFAIGRCLIPGFDGVILSKEWKDTLWDKFVTEAPRPRPP